MSRKIFILLVFIAGIAGCTPNNITIDNSLEKYFKENNLTGTFGLLDNSQGHFHIYNIKAFRDSVYTPFSTFKIVSSLIGLETGIISDEEMIIPWDGISRSVSNWNQDLSMKDAFTYSSVPWYQEMVRRIGKDTMQTWLDSLGYGSKNEPYVIADNLDTFWLDNSLKISPDEQLGVVKKLYFTQLPFKARTQRVVKEVMIREQNSNYTLAYKTGWGINENNQAVGWITGWIEENRHPYFFVLMVKSDDKDYDMSEVRIKMIKDILTQYDFFHGKK